MSTPRKALTLRRTLALSTVACAVLALGCSRVDEAAPTATPPAPASAVTATATATQAAATDPVASPAATSTASSTAPTTAPPAASARTGTASAPVKSSSGAVEVERGTSGRPEVALTFDCGWRAEATPEILRILEEEDIVTTWFMMGIWAEAHPDLTKRIAAKHELATHSWDHPDYRDLTDAQIAADLKRTDDFLRAFSGRGSAPIWRAPSAARDQRVLDAAARAGFPVHVFWTTGPTAAGFASGDSLDWTEAPSAAVRANLLRAIGLGGGSILVVHCDAEATRDVLREVIREYRKAGLQFVTVSQLLRP